MPFWQVFLTFCNEVFQSCLIDTIFEQLIKLKCNQKIPFITGKPPLFEVRQWDDYAKDLENYAPVPEENLGETSDLTNNNITSSDSESGKGDKDHARTWSTKWSTRGPVMKRSSPMQVYTHKVNCLRLHALVKVLSDWELYHNLNGQCLSR